MSSDEIRYLSPPMGMVHAASVCSGCGVLVYNQQAHTSFHEALAGVPVDSTEEK